MFTLSGGVETRENVLLRCDAYLDMRLNLFANASNICDRFAHVCQILVILSQSASEMIKYSARACHLIIHRSCNL